MAYVPFSLTSEPFYFKSFYEPVPSFWHFLMITTKTCGVRSYTKIDFLTKIWIFKLMFKSHVFFVAQVKLHPVAVATHSRAYIVICECSMPTSRGLHVHDMYLALLQKLDGCCIFISSRKRAKRPIKFILDWVNLNCAFLREASFQVGKFKFCQQIDFITWLHCTLTSLW